MHDSALVLIVLFMAKDFAYLCLTFVLKFSAAYQVAGWRARLAHEATLSEVATATGWDSGAARTLGAARALYLRLPPNVRLWTKAREFEVADEGRLHGILA